MEQINKKIPGNNNSDSSTTVDPDDEEDIMAMLKAATSRAMEANMKGKNGVGS